MFNNALVSVSDKSGLAEFVKPLASQGTHIVSTGGTANQLQEAGIKIQSISEFTGHPEVFDGRVKTLHPRVHMALLARQSESSDLQTLEDEGITPFDLVVVNLYPFERKPDIENIDIGGPCMLRAAAKSFDRIAVICDPADYSWVLEKGADLSLEDRKRLAAKAFRHVSVYDSMISKWLEEGKHSQEWSWGGRLHSELRYGENPHQKAFWLSEAGQSSGLHNAKLLQGKALSYNNILDLNAAVRSLRCFRQSTACVAVKHLNPCGVAQGDSTFKAVQKALEADPKSVFGGILAISAEVDGPAAEAISQLFLECVVAPSFSSEATKVFSKKKNLRLLEWPDLMKMSKSWEHRSIDGGLLLQESDNPQADDMAHWKFLGDQATEERLSDLKFAWAVCANLKSNAIALVANGQSRGLGMGQVNRVDAVAQAIQRAKEHHPEVADLVLASDAFFPFPDSIDLIADAGIRWVIQPGGSIKDNDVIQRAKERRVNLVLTGRRHFNH